MRKKNIFALLALLIVGIISTGLVTAHIGDNEIKGSNYSEERHEAMTAAFESNDYLAWKTLVEERAEENDRTPKVLEVINEDNFDTFVEAHNARVSGDHETAKELAEELGLNQFRHKGRQRGQRLNRGSCTN